MNKISNKSESCKVKKANLPYTQHKELHVPEKNPTHENA